MVLDKGVGRVASIVTTCLALALLGTLIVLFVPSARAWIVPPPGPAYATGELVDVPPSLYEDSDRTLIVFARSSCRGCQRAKPLLKMAVASFGGQLGWSRVLVATGSNFEADQAYGQEIGLSLSEIVPAPIELRLGSVPTLLVVDRDGRIMMSREGIIWSPEEEREVLRELTGNRSR